MNHQWQLSANLEIARTHYQYRKKLNGNYYLFSPALLFIANAQQYWFVDVDYYRKNAEQQFNAFTRLGVRLGWGQEWSQGISTRLQFSYACHRYQSAVTNVRNIFLPPFYQERQKNHEFGTLLSIWHRQIHFWGITPKLTWSYQQIKSNHPFSEYDKHRIYLELSKTF